MNINKTLKPAALLMCLSTFHTTHQNIYPYPSNGCTLDRDFRFSTSHKDISCSPAVNKCLLFLSDFNQNPNISTTTSTNRRYRISYRSAQWEYRSSGTMDGRTKRTKLGVDLRNCFTNAANKYISVHLPYTCPINSVK